MRFLVGDVQGCWEALQRLLSELAWSPSRDELVLLGDLVNRGPASMEVLRFARENEGAVSCLLGNHDLHFLATAMGVRTPHRQDTLDGLLNSPDLPSWVDWLRQQPLALMRDDWLCVHAGVSPAWDAAACLAHAKELSDCLKSEIWQEFLSQMYGNEPLLWADGLSGSERLRYITNTLTRMRFVEVRSGALELASKEGASGAPPGCVPWFEFEGRQSQDQAIAFGHWSTLGLIQTPKLLALDTGCVWGGCLTAVRIDGGRQEITQVKCPQTQQPGL